MLGGQWYRRQGCKCTPKSFDFSKIRTKSLKFKAKMVPNVQKMAPNACRKTQEDLFLEVTPKKVFLIFMGKKLKAKFAQKLFGQVWLQFGQKFFSPTKFAYSCTLCWRFHLFKKGSNGFCASAKTLVQGTNDVIKCGIFLNRFM